MEKRESRKVAVSAFLFFLALTLFAGYWFFYAPTEKVEIERLARQNQILKLNEIEKLTQQDGISPANEQIQSMMQEIRNEDRESNGNGRATAIMMYVACILFLLFLFLYLYIRILRPFEKLQEYSSEIARGNLDVNLTYERQNMFGAFTWAFDHMRREILKARKCEQEAITNNKTIIATLSHDIKTPIASIRAYTEGLEANLDTSVERRQRYIKVIMKKCDEVTALTNDLFLHSLSDMEKLQIVKQPAEISILLKETIEELTQDESRINMIGEPASALLELDVKRFAQLIENIIGNAEKYAEGSKIDIWTNTEKEGYEIHIRDYGQGIRPEDMPFVFDKFYRGRNINNAQGAGLGLYIVKYIMEQMGGSVQLISGHEGLEVILLFS